MELKKSLADMEKCLILNRLAHNLSKADVETWQSKANTLASTFERIIQYRSALFWSSIIYNSSIMESFDAALEALPRSFEVDEYRLVYGWDSSVSKAASRLYYSVLALFLRLAVFNKEIDNTLSQKEYLELIRGREAMPAKRLIFAFSFFMDHKQLMIEVARKQSYLDSRFRDDINRICANFDQCTSLLISKGDKLLEDFYGHQSVYKWRTAKQIDCWFCDALSLCNEGDTAADVLLQASLLNDPREYVVKIPALVECVARLFPTEVIIDVASALSDYPLKRLLRLRAQLEQSAVKFYCTALPRMPQDRKIDMLLSVLEMDRFIVLLNEKENLAELLKGYAEEQRDYVERALEFAYHSQRAKTVTELGKCGLFIGLGDLNRLNGKIQQAIQEVQQIFPHFSIQYAHLCLRHFGYDAAQTIDALLERNEKLPLALRLVENADLTSTLTEQPTLPIFSFRNDDMLTSLVSSAQKRDSPTENANSNIRTASKSGSSFKGLISLAPIVPTPSNATVVKNETEEKPTNEVMKKLHEALDRLKLRRAIGGHLMETQQSENSERLVPMPNAKKYAGIQKLRISEADKVMIRPTYQKYFYETQMDDDMYDDEYDDEYEQKEFVVEPLNAELLSDESDEEGSCEVTDLTTISKSGQQRKAVDGDRTSTVGNSTSDGTKRESVVGDKQTAGTGAASRSNYTGGRQRQIKERHKNAFKQRGADRKMRGMY